MTIRIHNTLTRQTEELFPVEAGKVKIYLCGPTVYAESHLGHARGPVIFDSFKKYFEFRGYKVTLVVNITDVDDKIIQRAKELNVPASVLAEKVAANYFDCMRRLGVDSVDYFPRVTDHIPDIARFIQRLIEKGFAYSANGDVYFSVPSKTDYGKLSNRRVEELEPTERVEPTGRKRNPLDFALWKSSKPGEPEWPSPWGNGRPGWHIECSVMSTKYLGETFDIHAGGLDLLFPHHENEIAQSEAATGKPFARCWMHNGLLTFEGEKMSKSLGNLVTVSDLLDNRSYSAEALRVFVLSTHYRSPLDFSFRALDDAKKGLDGFHRFFERVERLTGRSPYHILKGTVYPPGTAFTNSLDAFRKDFIEVLDDDFNTARGVAILYQIASQTNSYIESQGLERVVPSGQAVGEILGAASLLRELGAIFGLFRSRPSGPVSEVSIEPKLLGLVLELREEARRRKDFDQADRIRAELARLDFLIEDRPEGPTWRRKS